MDTLDMPKPLQPLVALVSYDTAKISRENAGKSFLIDFYKISFKKDFMGQVKYGQGYYAFEKGGLAFLGPNQMVTMSGEQRHDEGYSLYFHADLIRPYPLGKNISQYGFFSYSTSEALLLSDQEKKIVTGLFQLIATELEDRPDRFNQAIIVSQIELLLNYSNRFYNRQFATRKVRHHDLITKMDQYLSTRFNAINSAMTGLPTVQEISGHLEVSPRYLSDMLKSLTGQSTQHHIHVKLMETAKDLLSSSHLSISQIAYKLGFEHPQSFNKLFKRYTQLSPGAFRKSFD